MFEDPLQGKEQTNIQTRARPRQGDDGFAELTALWPRQERMVEARRAYMRYRARHEAADILAAAQRYLDEKPARQWAQMLLHWLNTDPCAEPMLPLTVTPRLASTSEPPAPRINWTSTADAWLADGTWPSGIGPPPNHSGCKMPEGLHQRTLKRAQLKAPATAEAVHA